MTDSTTLVRRWLGETAAGGGHLVGVVQLYPLDPVGGAGGASAAGQPPLLLATDWPVNTPPTSSTTMRLELSGPLFRKRLAFSSQAL
jgi:hypothetical protein